MVVSGRDGWWGGGGAGGCKGRSGWRDEEGLMVERGGAVVRRRGW